MEIFALETKRLPLRSISFLAHQSSPTLTSALLPSPERTVNALRTQMIPEEMELNRPPLLTEIKKWMKYEFRVYREPLEEYFRGGNQLSFIYTRCSSSAGI
ncbi:uncharacterized protein LOC130510834 isoform X2 [Raphanus sativus]|uniref:Uncharacterized protein LOC130510834 isoform X2 n=1 Tax=Raphanus sativus TaxID=3726 RepID=A0A9W3DI72_RAPSA|nr:uncharacterized protein LOC130510834 isoform X2 [Raphanus sativus]